MLLNQSLLLSRTIQFLCKWYSKALYLCERCSTFIAWPKLSEFLSLCFSCELEVFNWLLKEFCISFYLMRTLEPYIWSVLFHRRRAVLRYSNKRLFSLMIFHWKVLLLHFWSVKFLSCWKLWQQIVFYLSFFKRDRHSRNFLNQFSWEEWRNRGNYFYSLLLAC
jgi:hypothetical protein